jgi:hypothetical protein
MAKKKKNKTNFEIDSKKIIIGAIILVVVFLYFMVRFGEANPNYYLSEKCTLPPGFACLDFSQEGNSIKLLIQNAHGFDVKYVSIKIPECGGSVFPSGTKYKQENSPSLPNGEKSTYIIHCIDELGNGKFKGTIEINYLDSGTGVSEWGEGEVIVKTRN